MTLKIFVTVVLWLFFFESLRLCGLVSSGFGNLTQDLNKVIRNIAYNSRNLPERIEFTNTKMIMHETGYLTKENGTWRYLYYLKDHVGSNRVVLDDQGGVVQINNFYPYGLTLAEPTPRTDQAVQPYKFGGKELDRDFGVDAYDFEARMYNPSWGIFIQPDPMAEKYYSISPYAYCGNNPIKYVDPTGMWIQYNDSTGSYKYNNGQWFQYQTSGENIGQYTVYTPASGSFLGGVLIGLNQLNKNVTGNGLLNFFANDNNNAFIVAGNANAADISNSALGTITLNSNFQGSLIPTENGIQMSPFWLDIGHELAHRQDVLKNGATQAGNTWLTKPDGTTIKQSEKYATHMENLMRADAGLSLRSHYASQGTGGWEPSRVLNAGTRVSTYYGTTYRFTPRLVSPSLPPLPQLRAAKFH